MSTKTTPLDIAVCPSCCRHITRAEIAASGRCAYECACGYEFHPCRPYTIAEIIEGITTDGTYDDVDIAGYTREIWRVVFDAVHIYEQAFAMDEHEMPGNRRLLHLLNQLKGE